MLNRRGFVEAAPVLTGDPRLRLPPASPRRYDGEEMDGLSPPSANNSASWRTQAALSYSGLLRQATGEGLSPPLEPQRLTAQTKFLTDPHTTLVV